MVGLLGVPPRQTFALGPQALPMAPCLGAEAKTATVKKGKAGKASKKTYLPVDVSCIFQSKHLVLELVEVIVEWNFYGGWIHSIDVI